MPGVVELLIKSGWLDAPGIAIRDRAFRGREDDYEDDDDETRDRFRGGLCETSGKLFQMRFTADFCFRIDFR